MKSFIKYDPPYGGQAFKKRGVAPSFRIISDFMKQYTDTPKFSYADIKLFKGRSKNEYGYDSRIYLEQLQSNFGKVDPRTSIQSIHDQNDFDESYEWRIQENDIDEAVSIVSSFEPIPKYVVDPLSICLSSSFQFVNDAGKIINYKSDEFVNNYFSKSHFTLHLSRINSIIIDFIFPFENDCTEFRTILANIIHILPIDLKSTRLRIYTPTKRMDTYKVRKFI